MDQVQIFGPFCLNTRTGLLFRDGAPIPLGQRAAALLRMLIERRDQVVRKDDLFQAAWPNQVVAESNLTVQIATLRNALGEDEHGQPWIATAARRGYRFAGLVREGARHEQQWLAPP